MSTNPSTCPPTCHDTNSCNYGVLSGYDADATYFGNATFDYCNYYTGECTRTKSVLYFVCSCAKFKEQKWRTVSMATLPVAYLTKECEVLTIDTPAARSCFCTGTSPTAIEGLDACPADGLPLGTRPATRGGLVSPRPR